MACQDSRVLSVTDAMVNFHRLAIESRADQADQHLSSQHRCQHQLGRPAMSARLWPNYRLVVVILLTLLADGYLSRHKLGNRNATCPDLDKIGDRNPAK